MTESEKPMNDPEYTPTRREWEELQMRFDVTLDGSLQVLSDEERAELEARISVLNQDAVKSAIMLLINRHPVEFENLLYAERESRDIHTKVESRFGKLAASIG